MAQHPLAESFLAADSNLAHLWQALRHNVQAWYEREATAKGTTDLLRVGELLGTPQHLTIPSEAAVQDDAHLERILDWYRQQHPANGAICWYLHPTPPVSLGARLFARGVEPNWEPHWMWWDLRHLRVRPHAAMLTIRIAAAEATQRLGALGQRYPRRVWRLIAAQNGQRVGGCTLNVTTGAWGIGGLFDMEVQPEARKQGIGTALAHAAGELAYQLGCQHVILNATAMGEPIYRRVGFHSLGYGTTWYLSERILAAPAPAAHVVRFLGALGMGDLPLLDAVGNGLAHATLQEPTLNGLTPFEIAARLHQSASATWLAEHGVIPDLLCAWDLGWKAQVRALIAEHPEMVRQRGGRWDATPLHYAIERNDLELTRVLLTVPNDLESKDAEYEATPLGWAEHFERMEIIPLLRLHAASLVRGNPLPSDGGW